MLCSQELTVVGQASPRSDAHWPCQLWVRKGSAEHRNRGSRCLLMKEIQCVEALHEHQTPGVGSSLHA